MLLVFSSLIFVEPTCGERDVVTTSVRCICMPCSPSAFSRRAVVSYWRKYVHEVLVNRLGGLSLPRKSAVRLTDRPDMTLDVYRGRKTIMQQYACLVPLCVHPDLPGP